MAEDPWEGGVGAIRSKANSHHFILVDYHLSKFSDSMELKKISEADDQAPITEQEICVTCGLCCDGTLFEWATVEEGEKAELPKKLQQKCFSAEEREGFKQPCPYFENKCTIYFQKKAHICSVFRCQLLKDLFEETINHSDAKNVVKNAIELRNEIFQIYKVNYKPGTKLSFTELLCELRKKNTTNIESNRKDLDLELLMFKFNILEILLVKHFKSSEEFNNFIMGNNR